MKSQNVESRLLATHISNNKDFEVACMSGDADMIVSIINSEMDKNKLFTKGSQKLRDDVLRMTQGKAKISSRMGNNILAFVWNSRLSGIGLAVAS